MQEINYLRSFFEDKKNADNEEIDILSLCDDLNLSLLRNMDLETAVSITYDAAEEDGLANSHDEVQMVLDVLDECRIKKIPQNFIPGILLIYLEICEACSWKEYDWKSFVPAKLLKKL